ncbi:MAG: ATP-binding cassette domain-containing protein [Candidatus Bathyarchaeota archaeon]|nr:ATP-binding cassette domain-containing protein [Candidatus Bathyarchaeota archaeon]MDH5495317.1 ATP-binding cassette domain-containing protein [Candidatus Bathyarchaeota archaeon]
MSAVEAHQLSRDYVSTKRSYFFGKKRKTVIKALDCISFEIQDGELFGLLGPNGAGKTTTVKILCTLLEPTEGHAFVKGYDVVKDANKVRKIVNMVAGGERMLYYRLTGRENLEYFADLYDVPRSEVSIRVSRLLDLVGLSDRADDEVEKYSKGMKQRLQICRGLINNPQVLFLDEPTLGLDVNIAKDIRRFIREKIVKEQGKTVLLTTHYMFEAEEMCDRVGFLNKGKLVVVGRPDELKRKTPSEFSIEALITRLTQDTLEGLRELRQVKNVIKTDYEGEAEGEKIDRIIISVDSDKATPEVLNYITTKQCRVVSVNLRGPTLEDLFVFYTGEK